MDDRAGGSHRRGSLRRAHRGEPFGRPRGADGGRNARRAPWRLAGTRGIGAGTGSPDHVAGRARRALGRRVPAVAARHRRPHLVRGRRRAAAAGVARLDPRAGCADPGSPAHDAASDPGQLRAPLHRGAIGQRAGRAVRAGRHAVQRTCLAGGNARRRGAPPRHRRRVGVAGGRRGLARPPRDRQPRDGRGLAPVRGRRCLAPRADRGRVAPDPRPCQLGAGPIPHR